MTTRRRVLLVDDEPIFLETMSKVLKARGYEVQALPGGPEALLWLERNECDVVVLDQRMPEMDGMTVLEHIQAARPILPVIMLTGHADMDVAIGSVDRGAVDFLLKPTAVDILCRKLDEAINRKQTLEGFSE